MIKPSCSYLLLFILSLSTNTLFSQESCESGNPEDELDNNLSKLVSFLEFVGKLCQDGLKQDRSLGSLDDASRRTCCLHPIDCEEIYNCGNNQSGIYEIWPKSRILEGTVSVFCDMDTDGGGWIVFQRRGDFGHPVDYFYNDWQTYKQGFGNIGQDFWIGNDLLFGITNQRLYTLRVDMKDLENETRFAVYNHFWIYGEEHNYKIHVRGYSGTAGDALRVHHGRMFSTKDRENDENTRENCALVYKGAWWYHLCHHANLNGLYLKGNHTTFADGVNWKPWKEFHYSLPFTEMKIRPFNNAIRTVIPN